MSTQIEKLKALGYSFYTTMEIEAIEEEAHQLAEDSCNFLSEE